MFMAILTCYLHAMHVFPCVSESLERSVSFLGAGAGLPLRPGGLHALRHFLL